MPNRIEIKTAALPLKATGTLVVYVAEDTAPTGGAADVWQATGLDWTRIAAAANFKGKQGQVIDLLAPAGVKADRLLVLGSGKAGQGSSLSAWTDRGGSLAGKLANLKANKVAVLLDEAGNVVSKAVLSERALGRKLSRYDRSLDMHVSNLRKKLGPLPDGQERIKTVRGIGYIYSRA